MSKIPKSKNRHAVALGRLGGRVSGKRRMTTMTPEARSAVAKKGADARWGKKPSK